ncbi:mechanosensitive ion channel family protein [Dyadobacter tibetensis]|uniref:mechanosensitive ion channel family protein n=1 Tax=Dyadobacter tibetensis TaxID=1211851 RepID=UPI0005C60E9D|nr:mechanosensitive ion channel family protein [Dyadobacter tibetensis]
MNTLIWGNTVIEIGKVLLFLAVSFLAIKIFQVYIISRLKTWADHTRTSWDNFLVKQVDESGIPILYISATYLAITSLNLPEKVKQVVHIAYMVAFAFFVIRAISSTFRRFVYSFLKAQDNSEAKRKQASGLITIVTSVIWVLGGIFIVDNLGYDATTLITGLGIGGIAIALAAQAILGDLFSYFVIFFDKPFEIGDFVVVDDKNGVIEYIGIKTTRIKTLSGEQLVCSNTDLTNSRLHNFKRMERRRIVFGLGVTYQTSHEQLKAIPALVRQIIEADALIQFDRGHFSGYGDFSLNFEFVYYVLSPDYGVYMDKQQAIYLDIFEAFEKRKIEFAYPTQTLFTQAVNSEETSKLEGTLNN